MYDFNIVDGNPALRCLVGAKTTFVDIDDIVDTCIYFRESDSKILISIPPFAFNR